MGEQVGLERGGWESRLDWREEDGGTGWIGERRMGEQVGLERSIGEQVGLEKRIGEHVGLERGGWENRLDWRGGWDKEYRY
jgi:hypothetical protein